MVVADVIVLHAVAGRRMDAAGAALERDVIADDDDRRAVEERMRRLHVFELAALERAEHRVFGLAAGLHGRLHQRRRHYIALIAGLHERIFKLGTDADRDVCRQRPRRRCPDYKVGVFEVCAELREQALIVRHTEFDVNGVARILRIFDFRFGKRRFALGAPVDWLQALVDEALRRHLGEDLDLLCLKVLAQGDIRIVPLADAAEALERVALLVEIAERVFAAERAQLDVRHRRGVRNAGLAARLQLGRQAVRIPAGDVRRLEAAHVLVANDEVLERLVQRRAEMHVAVRIRGAVMQNIQRLALVLFKYRLVNVIRIPLVQHGGLLLGEAGLHGKVGFGKVQCAFIIHGV